MQFRFREVIDVFASVAMMIAALGIVLALLGVIGEKREPTQQARASYVTGEAFPDMPSIPGDRPVAILWLNSQCRYCEESMSFYRRAIQSHGAGSVVVMGTETETQLRDYVNKNGLGAVQISSHRPGTLKFSATPTLAIVGADRRVVGVWVGKVSSPVEQQILSALSNLRAKSRGLGN